MKSVCQIFRRFAFFAASLLALSVMSCAKHGPVDPPPTPGVDTTSHTITWTHTTMGDIFYGAFAIGGKYFLVGYNGFNAEITVGQREGK